RLAGNDQDRQMRRGYRGELQAHLGIIEAKALLASEQRLVEFNRRIQRVRIDKASDEGFEDHRIPSIFQRQALSDFVDLLLDLVEPRVHGAVVQVEDIAERDEPENP